MVKIISSESESVRRKSGKSLLFRTIFTYALLVGLPVSSTYFQVDQNLSVGLHKICGVVMTLFYSVVIVFECMYNRYIWDSSTSQMCYLLHCVSGYCLILIFLKNRRRIEIAVQKLAFLHANLNSEVTPHRVPLKHYLIACFAGNAVYAIFTMYFFFAAEWEACSQRIAPHVPLSPENPLHNFYVWLAVFSLASSYHFSSLVIYMMLFICVNAYHTSSQLFAMYGRKLRSDIDNKSFSAEVASENIVLFKRIVLNVKRMDKALNSCTFIICLSGSVNVFNAMGIFFSADKTFESLGFFVLGGAIFLSSMIQFFYMTLSGEGIPSQNNVLKNEMIELSDVVIRQEPDESTIMMFKLLFQNIKSTKVRVTGLGLFKITKHLIPTVFGIVASYGVLLYQSN